jgi:MSHA biogenesis protein MshN
MGALAVSLINKVLRDLDARTNAPSRKASRPQVFDDLRPTMGSPRRWRSRMLVVVLFIAAAAGGLYVWQQGDLDTAMAKAKTWIASLTGSAPPPKPTVVAQQPAPVAPPESPTPVPVPDAAPATEGAVADGAASAVPPVSPDDTQPAVAQDTPPPAPETETTDQAAQPVRKTPAAAASEDDGRIEKTDRPQTVEELAEGAYREGVRFLQQSRPAQADQALRLALTHDPKHLAARELLAGLQLEQGRPAEARATLEQGIMQVPEYVPFALLLARLYVDQGAERNALAVLEKVRSEGANQPEYLAFLATLYQRAGRYAESVETYLQALGQRPQEGRWWLGLGISLEAQKNLPAAGEAYQRAKASVLDPKLARYAEQRLGALKNTK